MLWFSAAEFVLLFIVGDVTGLEFEMRLLGEPPAVSLLLLLSVVPADVMPGWL